MIPNELFQNSGDAPAFWGVDILWLILAAGETTNGEYSLMEQLCPKGSGPPPHTHTQREMFYILDGEIIFLVGDTTIKGKAGSFVNVPPGAVHSFRVDSKTARVLNSYAPAGFEKLIIETARPATARTLPPQNLPAAMDMKRAKLIMEQVGMQWVDAPDILRNNQNS